MIPVQWWTIIPSDTDAVCVSCDKARTMIDLSVFETDLKREEQL